MSLILGSISVYTEIKSKRYHLTSMEGYYDDIDSKAIENEERRVKLYSDEYTELVLASLKPKESLGQETHEIQTQFLKIVKGTALIILGGKTIVSKKGMAVVVPPRTEHNVINISSNEDLKFYSVYSGPKEFYMPDEMVLEIYKKGSARDYLRFCQSSKPHMKMCKTPSHWIGYMKGRSCKDVEFILKFAEIYFEENPYLYFEVVNQIFTDILYDYIKPEDKEEEEEQGIRPYAKAKVGKVVKRIPDKERELRSQCNTLLRNIQSFLRDKVYEIPSYYSEEKYGDIENLFESELFSIFKKTIILYNKSTKDAIDNEHIKASFLSKFTAHNIKELNKDQIKKYIELARNRLDSESFSRFSHVIKMYTVVKENELDLDLIEDEDE